MMSNKRPRSQRRSNHPTTLSVWDSDVAIVLDPADQKLTKDSVKGLESGEYICGGNESACDTDKAFSDPDFEKKYTKIKLPKLSNKVECYIDGVGKSGQKVIMGTVNLGKLGWQLNLQRRFRTVEIYVLRDFQAPA
jgi:hypothetical protein